MRRKFPGSFLIKKGLNPVTEALEVLDCAFKALPKGTQWEVRKADFNAQREQARRDGVTLTKRPADRLDTSKPLQIDGKAFGLGSNSVTIPGSVGTRNPVYSDPSAHHIQNLSPQAKAAAVYRHASEMNAKQFVECVGADQIEDIAFGKVGTAAGKAAGQAGRLHGYQTGSVF